MVLAVVNQPRYYHGGAPRGSSPLRPTQVRQTEPDPVLTTLDNPLSDPAERDDPVGAWLSLPRRIYLDTSTLQKLYDFGGEIFEGEPFEPVGRAARVQGPGVRQSQRDSA